MAEPKHKFPSLKRDVWASAAVFICLSIFVLVFQTRNVGFEPGHHGWVSSNGLAIISHATSDNGFVGYSIQRKDSQMKPEYDYFDRNPVFFSALMNLALESSKRSISQKVYLARQIMNVIFLATLVVAFLLLRELLSDAVTALSATLMTFSGYYYMYYKDKVHSEQPALLGFILLLYAILRYERTRERRFLYLSAAFAVSFGMGYVSLMLLGLWFCIEFLRALGAHSFDPFAAIRRSITGAAFRVLALCFALSAGHVSYNVVVEAHQRGVSVAETSTIDSAARRLGLKTRFTGTRRASTDWNLYLPTLAKRLVKSAVPYAAAWGLKEKVDKSTFENAALPTVAVIGLIALLIVLHYRQRSPNDRSFYALLVFSGFAWYIPMRYHAAPHNFTAIYFAGLLMVFFAALMARLPGKLRIGGLALSVAVFAASNLAVNADRAGVAASGNSYTNDFETIVDRLQPKDQVYVDGGHENMVPGSPFALGFYLSRQYITPLSLADYALSADREFKPQTLTPQNQKIFLFAIERDGSKHE